MLTYPDKEGVWEWFDDTGKSLTILPGGNQTGQR